MLEKQPGFQSFGFVIVWVYWVMSSCAVKFNNHKVNTSNIVLPTLATGKTVLCILLGIVGVKTQTFHLEGVILCIP